MNDRELLEKIAAQLYRWADESRAGGWSTHQVEPQRKLAGEIHEHIARQRQTASAISIGAAIANTPRR